MWTLLNLISGTSKIEIKIMSKDFLIMWSVPYNLEVQIHRKNREPCLCWSTQKTKLIKKKKKSRIKKEKKRFGKSSALNSITIISLIIYIYINTHTYIYIHTHMYIFFMFLGSLLFLLLLFLRVYTHQWSVVSKFWFGFSFLEYSS